MPPTEPDFAIRIPKHLPAGYFRDREGRDITHPDWNSGPDAETFDPTRDYEDDVRDSGDDHYDDYDDDRHPGFDGPGGTAEPFSASIDANGNFIKELMRLRPSIAKNGNRRIMLLINLAINEAQLLRRRNGRKLTKLLGNTVGPATT